MSGAQERTDDRMVCGWRVASDLPLPDLPVWAGDDRPADLTFRYGTVPAPDPDAVFANRFHHIGADGAARFEIPGIARYLARGGREVVVEPLIARDAPDIGLFLLHGVLAMLCHQRGIMPLRASCVVIEGRAIALAGAAGTGKSTLAAALVAAGGRLIADDVTVLAENAAGPDAPPLALPTLPRLTLWRDSLEQLNLTPGRRLRQTGEIDRFAYRADDRFVAAPMPLALVCHLDEQRRADQPVIRRLTGAWASASVETAIHRHTAAAASGGRDRLRAWSERLATRVPQVALLRPRRWDDLAAFVAALPGLLRPVLA